MLVCSFGTILGRTNFKGPSNYPKLLCVVGLTFCCICPPHQGNLRRHPLQLLLNGDQVVFAVNRSHQLVLNWVNAKDINSPTAGLSAHRHIRPCTTLAVWLCGTALSWADRLNGWVMDIVTSPQHAYLQLRLRLSATSQQQPGCCRRSCRSVRVMGPTPSACKRFSALLCRLSSKEAVVMLLLLFDWRRVA